MSPRMWRHFISDILEAIDKIQLYVKGMKFDDFQKDHKTIDAVIRNFIVIGEAANNIPAGVTEPHSEIPWRSMRDMRNFAVHEYWRVELRTIWETIQKDLPSLIPPLLGVLEDHGD